tara:strand:+ start:1294 stop:1539 length:246 start_codon:yes stop_codon:yes gene_type:complete
VAKKKAEKKGKKPHKNKPTSKKYKMYTIEGDTIKKAPTCPRCGPGIFLMNTDKRQYCGKCHYTEFKTSQKPAEKPVEKATA